MELAEVNIYRLTHIENLRHILEHGITNRKSKNHNPGYIQIGDLSLIDEREKREVVITNGEAAYENIILGDFIPFYFGIRMPMLYVIQMGGNFTPEAVEPANIVYIACSIAKILEKDLTFYFSDGHATDKLSTFYNHLKINDLVKIIDWKAVKSRYWGGNENLLTKWKRQAEFIVKEDIPVDCIIGYVVYNQQAKDKVISMGIKSENIKIKPEAYF